MASRKNRGTRSDGKRAKSSSVRRVLREDRPKLTRPASVEDFFGAGVTGNLLKGEYHREDVYAWFQQRHLKGLNFISDDGYYRRNGHEWKVSYGVRQALKQPLVASQVGSKYPFYVTWISPKTGKRLHKYFNTVFQCIIFAAEKAQYVDSDVSIVSRHGYHIPSKLRGKLPRKKPSGKTNRHGAPILHTYYWCPGCMTERRFKRTGDDFFALRKEWDPVKSKYKFRDRKLALLACTVCEMTNRDSKFRRSNQPWEVTKIKSAVRRVKRRR